MTLNCFQSNYVKIVKLVTATSVHFIIHVRTLIQHCRVHVIEKSIIK
jgi:hypothetical protein